jgi:histidyl-tRNA synthetase
MTQIQAPRGTRDILPKDQTSWQFVEKIARSVAEQFNFLPITVPTYEELALFQRSIGTGTDVMDKELFLVRGVRSEEGEGTAYALRPEGTAGIVRAFIQHGMHTWPQPVRLYSFVHNFRYDRPQKGRYREHVQFDIEYFGESTPLADAWTIFTAWTFLQKVGLRNIVVNLNTLGTLEERTTYTTALTHFLEPLQDQLSTDSKERLTSNPLRILDSKDAGDQKALEGAPSFNEYISAETKQHFEEVQHLLLTWKVSISLNPRLVRGLDYYSHTAFEFIIEGEGGQQASLGGGGRYNGLVLQLGGPVTGAVGLGIGIDRVVEELERQSLTVPELVSPQVFLVAADAVGREAIVALLPELASTQIRFDAALSKESVNAQLKSAGRSNAVFIVVIGEKEVGENSVSIKNFKSGEQQSLPREELIPYLQKSLAQ